jgi:hypothetical protein
MLDTSLDATEVLCRCRLAGRNNAKATPNTTSRRALLRDKTTGAIWLNTVRNQCPIARAVLWRKPAICARTTLPSYGPSFVDSGTSANSPERVITVHDQIAQSLSDRSNHCAQSPAPCCAVHDFAGIVNSAQANKEETRFRRPGWSSLIMFRRRLQGFHFVPRSLPI